ncbi:MAG: lactonase family protein [Betaproteobacteria bacterium]|nr:MAG: lactonase family protein [Betaproteobacteria bacterium]
MDHISLIRYRASAFRLALSGIAAVAAMGMQPASAESGTLTVYTESNAAAGNQLLVFAQGEDGSLALKFAIPTHGIGSGGGLSNEGAVAIAPGGSLLFAVNAASNSISAFRIGGGTVEFLATAPSGGLTPVSLAVYDDLLYVLNQGSDSITGFRIQDDGHLQALPGSAQKLSGAAVGGAQLSFSRGGDFLVATEKLGSQIGVFALVDDIAQPGQFQQSYGPVPFGFAVDRRDRLVVSEAGGSAVTSYDLDTDTGGLSVISGSVPTHQAAACWVAETPNGHFAFTGNAGSGSVSAFSIDHAGRLAELGSTQISAGAHTTDLAVSANGRYLFALDAGIGTINGFRIGADGHLEALPATSPSNLLAAATGLAVQ